MTTRSHNLGTLQTHLVNAHSFHPTLALTLTPSSSIPISALDTVACDANLLLHLPSGVFYDPYTASNDVIGATKNGRRAQRGTVLTSVRAVELEKAVGWVSRASDAKGGKRQWWERAEEASGAENEGWLGGLEGLDLQDVLSAALRKKAAEVVGVSEPVKLSLEQGNRVKVKPHEAPQRKGEDERERSTVVVPIDIDDLLNSDGAFRLDVPLHVRYLPPATSATVNTIPSSSFFDLWLDILPTHALSLYHTIRRHLGLQSPPTSPSRSKAHNVHLTLPPPTIYLACPPSSASSTSDSSVSKLFPKTHAHLTSKLIESHPPNFVVVAHAKSTAPLKLSVPVPAESLLAAVQLTTLVTVVAAALGVVYHLAVNVLPMVEQVEKLG